MVTSKCAVNGNSKSRFFKEQEGGGLLSTLGIRRSLTVILLIGPFFEV